MNLAGSTIDDLVDADPVAVSSLGEGWLGLAVLASEISARIGRIEPEGWRGEACDAFRHRLSVLPPVLAETAESLGSAAGVVAEWRDAVDEARSEIAAALELNAQGEAERRWWLANHEVLAVAPGYPVPDPSLATVAEAARIAEQTLERLGDRARWTESRLDGIADRASSRFSAFSDIRHALGGFAGGLGEAVAGIAATVWTTSPIRLVTDFDGVVEDVDTARHRIAGVVERFGEDPIRMMKDAALGALGFDALVSDPARWAGGVALDLVGAAGGVAFARHLDDLPELGSLPTVDGEVMERLARLGLVRGESLEGGHFVLRHGPHTTLEEQRTRATTGVRPDGTTGRKTDASRFLTWTDMFEAVEMANHHRLGTGSERVLLEMDRVVGEGFRPGSNRPVRTRWVELRFGEDGLYTAFPRLRQPPGTPRE